MSNTSGRKSNDTRRPKQRPRRAKAKSLRVVYDKDQHIDLAALEATVSLPLMQQWIRSRLEGNDPYAPVDLDSLEQPFELFIDLWQRADTKSAIRSCIDRACGALLPIARDAEDGAWVKALLELVATIQPVSAWPVLATLVQQVASEAPEQRNNRDEAWIEAATEYENQPEMAHFWKILLEDARYTQNAYFALRHDLALGVYYLPVYYRLLGEQERPLLIQETIETLLQKGSYQTRSLLERYTNEFIRVPGLCRIIDIALGTLEHPAIYQQAMAAHPGPHSVKSIRSTPVFSPNAATVNPVATLQHASAAG